MGRDRPRTGLSPVLPHRGRSPWRPTPNDQSSLVTEEEASQLLHRAVRGHQLVGRTQSEVVQGSTANGSQDVFGAAAFTTTHLPANQLQQRSHDDDFDPRAPPSPPPPPLEGRVLHTLEGLLLMLSRSYPENISLHCTSFLYMNSNI